MFDLEKRVLQEREQRRGIELYSVAQDGDINDFEQIYNTKLPSDIRAFYLEVNGYFDSDEMVNIYSLDKVKRISECNVEIGDININKNLFIIGDFCFQGSFWLLDIGEDATRYFVLNLGVVNMIKVANSFKYLLTSILEDPYSMIGPL